MNIMIRIIVAGLILAFITAFLRRRGYLDGAPPKPDRQYGGVTMRDTVDLGPARTPYYVGSLGEVGFVDRDAVNEDYGGRMWAGGTPGFDFSAGQPLSIPIPM